MAGNILITFWHHHDTCEPCECTQGQYQYCSSMDRGAVADVKGTDNEGNPVAFKVWVCNAHQTVEGVGNAGRATGALPYHA